MSNSESRNINLAVRYRLFGILRQNGWWNTYTGVHMSLMTGNDEVTNEPIPPNTYQYTANPKSYVFIDEFNEVWPSGVTLYDSGIPRPSGTYSVDYLNGRITLNTAPSGALTADLAIYTAQVRRGYPTEHELQFLDLPMLAYKCEADDGIPFVIGTTLQENGYFFNVFIMAREDGEQDDLTNDVRKNIRFVPYVDYSLHEPLGENNGLDYGFVYADQLVSRMFVLHGISGTYLDPKPGGSDKERYRSMISFEIKRIS